MEEIKIIFFVLGTLFGLEHNHIAADKTTVTISPETKTIAIHQEGLFAMLKTKEDSVAVNRLLTEISRNNAIWRPELADYSVKSCELSAGTNGKLNAKIVLKYNTTEDLKDYGLHFHQEGYFSFMAFPKENLHTEDGRLNGKYWHFDAKEPFTFTLVPYKDMPEKHRAYKRNLLSVWEGRCK